MSTITLKNISPAVHKALKTRAKAHSRSLNKEILATLEESFHATPVNARAVTRHAQAVRETMDVYLTEKDLTALKNTGRK